MKDKVAVVGVLALAAFSVACVAPNRPVSPGSPCHSSWHKETVPFSQTPEIQVEVVGFRTLASETPDYLSALRGHWDLTGASRSIALD